MKSPVSSLSFGVVFRLGRRFLAQAMAVVLALAWGSTRAQLPTEMVYENNSTSGTSTALWSAFEYGDEIKLAGGQARKLTDFGFDYYGDYAAGKGVTAILSLYKNDGVDVDPSSKTVLSPGTLLFQSDLILLQPGYHEALVSNLAIDVPASFTWTVTFNGLSQKEGDRVGLLFETPPSVGSSFDDLWIKQDGVWGTYRYGGDPVANLGARARAFASPLSLPILSNVSIPKDASKEVSFTVTSVVNDPGVLTLTATSDNPALVDSTGLVGVGTGLSQVLKVTPKPGQVGAATITITVSSSTGLSATGSFLLTVTDAANPLVFTKIQDMVLDVGQASQPAAFQIIGLKEQGGVAGGKFTSSNKDLITDFNINVTGDFVNFSTFQVTVTPNAGKSGVTTITIEVTSGTGAKASTSFNVTVGSPAGPVAPKIVNQPVGVTVDVGGTFTLSVSATGTDPLTYLWKFNSFPLDDSIPGVSGATTPTLKVIGAQTMMAGSYTVEVSNTKGMDTSLPAKVVVNPIVVVVTKPVIKTPPQGLSVDLGGTFTLSVVAEGAGPLTYVWKFNENKLVDDSTIGVSGSSTPNLKISNVQSFHSGPYKVEVSNSAGTTASEPVTVKVLLGGAPPEITQPGDIVMTDGDTAPVKEFMAVDPEGVPITIKAKSSNPTLLPDAGIVIGGMDPSYTVTVKPVAGQSGEAVVTLTANDGFKDGSVTFKVTVKAGNHAPVLVTPIPTGVAVEAKPFTLTVVAEMFFDPDQGDSLTLSATGLPAWLKFDASTGRFSGTPSAGDVGDVTVVVIATDKAKATAEASFRLSVKPANKPPTISTIADLKATAGQNVVVGPVAFTVGDDATAAADLVVSAEATPGTLVAASGIKVSGAGASRSLTLPLVDNQAGTVVVKVKVKDADGLETIASFKVVVDPKGLTSQDGSWLRQLYADLLGRAPNTVELNFWIGTGFLGQGASQRGNVVAAILGSSEYRTLQVQRAYRQFMKRDADQGGLAFFVNVLGNGGSETDLWTAILGSEEYFARFDRDNAKFLTGVFQELFQQAPTSAPLSFSLQQLQAGTIARATVVKGFLTSTQGLGSRVGGWYHDYLRRWPTLSEVPFWVTAAASGNNPLITVLSSAEYLAFAQNPVVPADQSPVLGTIADVSVQQGASTVQPNPILTVADPDTPSAFLTYVVRASNSKLVQEGMITVDPTAGGLALSLPLVSGAAGESTITVEVGDHTTTKSTQFLLTVVPASQPPAIKAPAAVTIPDGSASLDVNILVSDPDSAIASVTLKATSPNKDLFPDAGLVVRGEGSTRTLTLTPAKGYSGTTTVNLVASDGKLSANVPVLVTVSRPPAPVITDQTGSLVVGVGGEARFSVTAQGTGLSYKWFKQGAGTLTLGTESTLVLKAVDPGMAGVYFAEVSGPGGTVRSKDSSLTVVGPPVFQTSPIGATVPKGAPILTLQGSAYSPLAISYSWLKDDTTVVADGPNVSGASTPFLTLRNVTPAQAGKYVLVATGAGGRSTSGPAVVVVQVPPSITTQPVSQVAKLGTSVTFKVGVDGTGPFQYQWRKNGANLGGATSPTLNIPAVTLADGGTYTVAISSSLGAVNSDPAVLTPDLPALPASDSFASRGTLTGNSGSGRASNVGAKAESGETSLGGASIWIKWTAPENGQAVFDTIGSSFDTILVVATGSTVGGLTPVGRDDDSGEFLTSRLQVNVVKDTTYSIGVTGKNGATGTVLFSWAFTASPVQVPTITIQPASVVIPIRASARPPLRYGSASLSVTATGNNLKYQWFKIIGSDPLSGHATSILVSGATSSSFVVTGPGQYFVRVTGDGGTVDSRTASVTASFAISPPAVASASSVKSATARFAKQDLTDAVNELGAAGLETSLSATLVADTSGFASSPGEPNHCGVVGGASTWFTYRAPADGLLTVDTDGSDFDTVLAVYTGDPTSLATLTPVTCDDNSGPDGKTSKLSFAVKAGSEYHVAADGKGGATGLLVISYSLSTAASISVIADQSTDSGKVVGPVAFSVSGESVSKGSVVVSAGSSNQGLLPDSGILVGGTGTNRTLTLTPSANQSGETTVTVSASDGANVATRSFKLTVRSVNSAPTLSGIGDQSGLSGTVIGPISFSIQDAQTPASNLVVTASSSDPAVVANSAITLAGTGSSRSISIAPVAGASGTSTVTVVVKDPEGLTGTNTFKVQVTAFVGAPVIVSSPLDASLLVGQSLTLSVDAIGSQPLNYQWYKNGFLIDLATNRTLTIGAVVEANAGSYYAVVSNAGGSATSALGNVAVAPLPTKDPSLAARASAEGFVLTIKDLGAKDYALEASTDLVTWTSIATVPGGVGDKVYVDPIPAGSSKRFYRVRSLSQP